MTLVKNINGTSNNKCKCGSWLKHWEKFSDREAFFCSVKNCNEMASDGAHVQLASSSDNNWYIVPMCKKHNLSKDTVLTVTEKLVSANVDETCG